MKIYVPKPPSGTMLRELLKYRIDPEDGRVYGTMYSHSLGSVGANGRCYIDIKIKGERRNFMRYHLVWWRATGRWPPMELDHKDGNPLNDRIDNLEPVTRLENVRRYHAGR